jgi:diadenosine tetraphosphate (Ap4A) HIT family hydrolase
MPTVFTRIITGEWPGTFVWRDEVCVGFLSINPMAFGHVLVVPIVEVDHWIDLDTATADHLFRVAHIIGRAQQQAFGCSRVGLIIAGYEVPHTHLHVVPTNQISELSFAHAATSVDRADLERAGAAMLEALAMQGHQPLNN